MKLFLYQFKGTWVNVHPVNALLMFSCCSLSGAGISQCHCVGEMETCTSALRFHVCLPVLIRHKELPFYFFFFILRCI